MATSTLNTAAKKTSKHKLSASTAKEATDLTVLTTANGIFILIGGCDCGLSADIYLPPIGEYGFHSSELYKNKTSQQNREELFMPI